ncbi:GNAT family N-acetyltransferase [Leptospira yasudae]|uniref:GNAT family N-acetyltransferase n=1 Tax=Leptospira yasudae TaxID=2202201 RepID=A0ABX9M2L0_9LEPT|nr:GNAT family protein [Leptospira yasudae]RHX79724.1 GNAT family N-acetyltransferase [Leptospira yasudae]RHX95489.1 GNAT family N-acetyltransferase [Leptospira yasudae]TGK27024.1 N-acetyltransferase [Leptospira yasudae]TGM08182.1 N-acetyltransferase [Leptospira yasudae]
MIRLEPFETNDIPLLISWVDTQELLLQFSGPVFRFPLTEDQLLENLRAVDRKAFRIIETSSNERIGYCELASINMEHGSARLSRLLIGKPEFRGKGMGRELVKLLLRICFVDLGLHRVALNVYDFNKAAIACYQNVGFQIEGLNRDTVRFGDGFWSGYEMSILRPEWEALQVS